MEITGCSYALEGHFLMILLSFGAVIRSIESFVESAFASEVSKTIFLVIIIAFFSDFLLAYALTFFVRFLVF